MRRTLAPLAFLLLLLVPLLVAGPSPEVDAATRTPPSLPRPLPFDLTASDGSGLSLVALDARGVLEGPLAFTELRLTFDNPRDQTIEGRFRITLPSGAAISRFAMKIGDGWQEGEVVERQRARQIYEDFLHRRQDPALLEQEAGNEFSARVFPIPARGRKELIVSYSHALERGDEPYVIPLLGLPEIERLDVRLLLGARPVDAKASSLGGSVSDRRIVEIHKTAWTPDRDFEVPQDAAVGRRGLRHENLVAVRVAPRIESTTQKVGGLFVLLDSSASRALGYAAQVDLLSRLLAELDGGTPVAVAAFDQSVTPIWEGTAGAFGESQRSALREHRALGASDLHRALTWLGERPASARRYPRLLLVGDGVATAGETDGAALAAAVADLAKAGVERLDAVAVGGLRDQPLLARLVAAGLPHDGVVLDGSLPAGELAARLGRATRSGLHVEVPGAEWVWPRQLDGVQAGDEVLVFADLPASRPLAVRVDGRPVELGGEPLAPTEPLLLERAWVARRIDRLLALRDTDFANDQDLRSAMVAEVTRLSLAHRVLSPFTAFLVLETEWDYQRYGLERTALADILTVGAGGLETVGRRPPTPPPPPPPPPPRPMAKRVPLASGPTPRQVQVPDSANESIGADERAEELERQLEELEGDVGQAVGDGDQHDLASVDDVAFNIPDEEPAAPVVEHLGETVAENIMVASESPRQAAPAREGLRERRDEPADKEVRSSPWSGRYGEVEDLLVAGRGAEALRLARDWVDEAPGDVLALLALGDAAAARGDLVLAARAYGSLIDLFPARADLRRHAGERLEALASDAALELAVDTYAKAVAERPDHPSGHRLLAWALFRTGRLAAAFAALETGLDRQYPSGRFAGVDRVLREDLGLLASAWLAQEPGQSETIREGLRRRGASLPEETSLRFVLTWETDANDVDLHVHDGEGHHAFYSSPRLASGGELFADVTTGYGPECFAIPGAAARRAGPYRLAAHYYRRGPMGFGLGTLQVVRDEGDGKLAIEARPFVVMNDGAFVELGTVKP